MRTAKSLECSDRRYYLPELSTCPACGGQLVPARHLAWRKVIQTLQTTFFAASRPSFCPKPACRGSEHLIRSDAAERLSLPGSGLGLDVIAEVGRLRTEKRLTRTEIWSELRERVQISERHVQNVLDNFWALLACATRLDTTRLTQAVADYGGLIVSLDGLRPENGRPQLWLAREVLSGQPLRAEVLAHADVPTLTQFLAPLRDAGWPILAALSDKQQSILDAVQATWPGLPHQLCQAHYLRDAAEPLYERDRHMAVQMRKTLRDCELVRQAATLAVPPLKPEDLPDSALIPDGPAAPLTPRPLTAPPPDTAGGGTPPATALTRPTVVQSAARLVARTLTLRGRPPFKFAGLRMYHDLMSIQHALRACQAFEPDGGLQELEHLLQSIRLQWRTENHHLRMGFDWLGEIAALLDEPLPTVESPRPKGRSVARKVEAYLKQLQRLELPPDLHPFRQHLIAITRRFAPGLYVCYDIPGLPRTNNELESIFRRVKSLERRIEGRQHINDTLLCYGPWLLIGPPYSHAALLDQFQQVDPHAFQDERTRLSRNQEAFRDVYHSEHDLPGTLQQLIVDWTTASRLPSL